MSSQLQVSGEAKIRAIQGPVVANSGVITALNGGATQYVRGDGTLADFPTSTGGGSSVSYYLNSSVSQGTIGGVAYRQLSKTPISGAGTDIAISTTGYVASYLTDANDPALLEVPAGNFNCEFYFSVNSNSHNPYVYAELYKYDGTTFTLLGSNVAIPEYLTNGTTLSAYYFAIPVAVAALTITDRLAIRIYVNVDGRVVTLHTENSHLCQVVTTFSKGLISLNNLTRQNQFFATGTSGTDFGISSSVATHTFNLPVASATNTGKLSSTDWSTFNGKVPYTGATANLDLGLFSISGSTLFLNGTPTTIPGYLYLKKIGNAAYINYAGYGGITAYSNNFTFISDVNGTDMKKAIFDLASLTNNTERTFTLPDLSGTLALLEGTQTFTGDTTFSNDLLVNGVRVGIGSGGVNNARFGALSFMSNTTGGYNTAIGTYTLNANTTGGNNTALGNVALGLNTTGSNNTAIGGNALGNITTGSSNIGLGITSGASITTGSNNTIIGNYAGTTTLANNIVLADGAGNIRYQFNGTNNIFTSALGINSTSLTGISFRNSRNLTGATTTYANYADGQVQTDATAISHYFYSEANVIAATTASAIYHFKATQGTFGAGSSLTVQAGLVIDASLSGAGTNYGIISNIDAATNNWNLYIGGSAKNWIASSLGIGAGTQTPTATLDVNGTFKVSGAATFSSDITVNGVRVGKGASSVAGNTVVGEDALISNTGAGTGNTAIGYACLNANTSGGANTGIGNQALVRVTTGSYNIGIGFFAGENITTGNNNTIIGNYAGTAGMVNNIILADGAGTIRYQWNGTNNVFGNPISGTSATFSSSVTATSLNVAGSGYFPSKIITLTGAEPTRYSGNIGLNIVGGSTIAMSFGTRNNNVDYDNTLNIINGNVGIGTSSPSYKFVVSNNGAEGLEVIPATVTSGLVQLLAYNRSTSAYSDILFEGGNVRFNTNGGGERMRITSGGDVGIGTSTIGFATANRRCLEVNGAGTSLIALKVADQWQSYWFSAGDNADTYLYRNGNAGNFIVVNNSAGVYLAPSATSWTSNSDERLKDITGNIDNALSSLMTLRTIKHTWKSDDSNKEHLGLIAQDVEKVFPQVIDKSKLSSKPNEEQTDETEYLGVRYQELIPVLIAAIQELKAEIDELKNK